MDFLVGDLKVQAVCTLLGHTDTVWCVAWHPSRDILASCGADRAVRIWRATSSSTWQCVQILSDAHSRTVRSCAWSPCGVYLATCSFDGTTCVWRAKRRDSDANVHDSETEECDTDSAKSKSKSKTGRSREARTHDSERQADSTSQSGGDLEVLATLEGHENEVKCVSWNCSSNLLATCGRDKSIWIWELDEDEEIQCCAVLSAHAGDVKSITFARDDEHRLASCSYDNSAKLWMDDGDDWHTERALLAHTDTVWCVAFDAHDERLASASADGTIRIWNVSNAHTKANAMRADHNEPASEPDDAALRANRYKVLCTVDDVHAGPIYCIDWCALTGLIATCSADNGVTIASRLPFTDDPTTETYRVRVKVPNAHVDDVNCVAWSPRHAGLFASCGDDAAIKVWRVEIE